MDNAKDIHKIGIGGGFVFYVRHPRALVLFYDSIMQNEFIDILDKNGEFTGEIASRERVHFEGLWHTTVHVWVCNYNEELLFQRRSKNKESFSDMWDVSVAAHVLSGETLLEACVRENLGKK